MGTIAQKLTYLEDTKTAIGNAITVKGGSVTGKTFRQYATEISNLPSGGGGTPIAVSKDVSDYTGGTTFNFLEQITDVNWPSGIESIGSYSFYKCIGLTSITIPNSVTSIGNYAFSYCKRLTSITVEATKPPTLSGNIVFNDTNNCPIYVPAESVATYKATAIWSKFANRIQAIP